MWVDLFSPDSNQILRAIVINGKTYKATSIESQILCLAFDIHLRARAHTLVRKKWLDKLAYLQSLQNLNWAEVQNQYEHNLMHFGKVLPETPSNNVHEYIHSALQQKPTSRIADWWFLAKWRFSSKRLQGIRANT